MNCLTPVPSFPRRFLSAAACLFLVLSPCAVRAELTFLGVAAGDVSDHDATVWTRAVDPAAPAVVPLTLHVSTDGTFASGVMTLIDSTVASRDYTLKIDVTGLQPSTVYYYRFIGPNSETSHTGRFKTAPAPTASAPVHFAFSGDMDGLMRPYALASTLPAQNLDFYINLGDVIYETASNPAGDAGLPQLTSPAVVLSGTIPAPSSTGATQAQLFADYSKKYREQFLPVHVGGQNSLRDFYAAQGNYTLYDNHELGNRQYINGGAPAGGPVGDMPSGAGVDARDSSNDVNVSGPFINQTIGFTTLQQVYFNYQPIADRGAVVAPSDPRSQGTRRLYFAQPWGRNAIFINVDDRSYRDIRIKTAANADDTGPRAGNPGRTMLGATQLAWLEQTLLNAQKAGTPWKFIAISDPIDQIGPISGALSGVVNTSGNPSYSPVAADGGKSWIGGYRAERNALLKFIADHQIANVVFLATDDHQNRVNELTYSTTGQTEVQSTYAKVPSCFQIVCGPLGATGPDLFLNHDFGSIKTMADSFVAAQTTVGVEPFGLMGYPGLHDVKRENDPLAGTAPTAVDFYSPDTFNYNTLDVSADGKTLTVRSLGINATPQNSASEYGAAGNTVREIFSFKIDALSPLHDIDHIIVVYQENWSFDGLYGSFPGANGVANASATSLDQLTLAGASINTLVPWVNPSRAVPVQNPPAPLNGNNAVDTRFLTDPSNLASPTKVDTTFPYLLTDPVLNLAPTDLTGDIVHRYWTEALQINGGANNKFLAWSDNPGLVMSRFDASNLPEGLLAQQYTLCDNFFHSAFGGSFLNHQFLVAAAAPVYLHADILIPNNVTVLDANGALAVNSSGKIIRDQNITPIGGQVFGFPAGTTFDQNYAVNTIFSANLQSHGGNPSAATLLPSLNNTDPAGTNYSPTIGDRLDAAGVSWKWYSGGWDAALESSPSNPVTHGTPNTVDPLFQWHHQPFAYFEKYKPFDASQPDGRNPVSAAHLQDKTQFFADLAAGSLPAVAFIKNLGPDNEHPGYAALQQGQQAVADIVAAVQAQPALWAHTAIIVTYDEHGGRWDHVAPPVRDLWGPGLRVPTLVISPLAKRGFVDHTAYDTSAILKTIEQRFALPPLNQRDANATSLEGAFTHLLVQRGGYSFNRRLNRIVQTITVTNQASAPITGPIYLAIDQLSTNTSLANSAGVTANNAPLGSPYVLVKAGTLAPGETATVALQFAPPSPGAITYSTRTIAGASTP